MCQCFEEYNSFLYIILVCRRLSKPEDSLPFPLWDPYHGTLHNYTLFLWSVPGCCFISKKRSHIFSDLF